jgi:hypothetical protein
MHHDASLLATIREVADTTAARKVFGEPIAHDGVTVLLVANVRGGGSGAKGAARSSSRVGYDGGETAHGE